MTPSEMQFIVGIAWLTGSAMVLCGIGRLANIWLKSNVLEGICYILFLFYFVNSAILGAIVIKEHL